MKTYICLILYLSVGYSEKYEGDTCETNTNEPGVCVRLELCPSAQEFIKKSIHPVNCGFVKNTPIVCCAKFDTKHTYLAEKKCDIYNTPILGVIGGTDAKIKEFPHMAALGYTDQDTKKWLCGGTLISENFVLTAGHCLNSLEYGLVKWVRLGVLDINEPEEEDLAGHQNFEVVKRIKHPLYSPPLVYHDIGLIQLDKFIKMNLFVKPVCLYTEKTIPEGTELFATGWGLTQVGGKQSNILQKVTLDLFNENECDSNYNGSSSRRKLKHGILHEQQICAGGKTIEADTCQGDSGGPLKIKLVVDYDERFYIVGVTSFGKSCGIVNIPGIYTRVSYYVPWIESVIWPNEQ